MNKSRECFAPNCEADIPVYMPFCAKHMKNDWYAVEVSA